MYALNPTQRQELLNVARRSLSVYLETGVRPVIEARDSALLRPAGAFVTLHRHQADDPHRLRGCIGTFEQDQPLIDTVSRMAIAAGINDPRFEAVTASELPDLVFELSVLSPRRMIQAEEVEVGVHGLFITRGARRGVLLPQVATERGWDAETFLDQTCQKASLPRDAWKFPDTVIEAFTAEVFGEENPPPL